MTSTNTLPLNTFLTYRMARVQAKLNAQGARLLREVAGLSLAQWRIIVILGSEGETTSSSLSRNAQIDKGLLSRKLKLLIEDGIVQSTPDQKDRRIQRLKLTAQGQRVYADTLPHMQQRQEKLRALYSEAELAALFDALQTLEAALDAELGNDGSEAE